ncbi:MAG: ATP-binding protein, partial [Minisyncoccia bacterium]
ILDEAHMLSKAAWNAFLKTLEEPPAYAVFILATTELERVPETVQSRCQLFEFKKPSRKDLAKVVAQVAKKEGCELAPDAAELIALLAEGSYRDALSVLQKVIAAVPGKAVSLAATETATGAPQRAQVHTLLQALASANRADALSAIELAATSGIDMKLFLEMVLDLLRKIVLLRQAPDLNDSIRAEVGDDEWKALVEMAKAPHGSAKITHATLRAFLEAAERIRYAPIPALPLELAVLELFPE